MFCRIADTPQFAYSPSKGIFAYDWDEAFDVTDFIIKLCLYNSETGTEQIKKMLQRFSQYPFENDAELCLQSVAKRLNANIDALRPGFMQTMNRFSIISEKQISALTDVLSGTYPIPLVVYYEEYIRILQIKTKGYILVKKKGHKGLNGFYAIPNCFSKKKEDAERFAKCMHPYIGNYDCVYTRNEKGRELLLEGRVKALANREERCISHKKVKGALE